MNNENSNYESTSLNEGVTTSASSSSCSFDIATYDQSAKNKIQTNELSLINQGTSAMSNPISASIVEQGTPLSTPVSRRYGTRKPYRTGYKATIVNDKNKKDT